MTRSISPTLASAKFVLAAFALAGPSLAQNLCEGNGVGAAYIRATPAVIGGSVRIDIGSPTAPGGFGFLSFSGGLGPTVSPFVGPMCFDVNSPLYTALFYLLDGSGNATLSGTIPNSTVAYGYQPLYLNAFINDATGFGLSKTARLQWELPDVYRPILEDAAVSARSMHTATPLWRDDLDNRQDIFLAGGATGTIIIPVAKGDTFVWEPLTRSWKAGPFMSLPRAQHRSVRMLDGRVLITGGATTAGAGTATCDIYDPDTNTITPAASMSAPRMSHAISLLDDGRVLVSGGFADWQNASSSFAAALSTAQNTIEVYDPVTDTWSSGPTMADNRAGHGQSRLPDGRILITAGVTGGIVTIAGGFQQIQIPTFTDSCQIYNPIGNTLANVAPIPFASRPGGRGFHAAGVLPNGQILVTGGAASGGAYGQAICQNDCQVYDLASNTWTTTAGLQVPVAFHSQVLDRNSGDFLITGGFTGEFGFSPCSTAAGFHDGTTFTQIANLGVNAREGTPNLIGRAGHTVVQTQDGSFFLWGGQDTSTILALPEIGDGLVYVR